MQHCKFLKKTPIKGETKFFLKKTPKKVILILFSIVWCWPNIHFMRLHSQWQYDTLCMWAAEIIDSANSYMNSSKNLNSPRKTKLLINNLTEIMWFKTDVESKIIRKYFAKPLILCLLFNAFLSIYSDTFSFYRISQAFCFIH